MENKPMGTSRFYLEALMNAVLSLDPESGRELARVEGRTIGLEVTDTRFSLQLAVTGTGVRLLADAEARPDVSIQGTAAALFGYLLSSLPGNSRPAGSIEVMGDVNLAQEFQSIMKRFEPDWEEAMSHWTGDTVARKLGNLVRGTARTLKNGIHTLELDVSEYLRFESGAVPDREEMIEFLISVEKLRSDVERLKTRVAGLG